MAQRWNHLLLRAQIQVFVRLLDFSDPIVWIENTVGITVTKKMNAKEVLYYRTDKFESFRELRNSAYLDGLEKQLNEEADFILCVSSSLYEEKLKCRKRDVYYVPHGVDFQHFNNAVLNCSSVPEEMKHITHQIVGYFGSLTPSNDEALIHYCASRRPDLSFVLIGEVLGEFRLIRSLPNVHFLGQKDYPVLPDYSKHFDVCIMFWKASEWIKHCNPIKTMEYLALGKPIVSVPIDEISKIFKGLVRIATNQEDFLRAIEKELENDSLELRTKRTDYVRGDTWEARAEQISNLIEKAVHISEKESFA